jgi:hypothetical protein
MEPVKRRAGKRRQVIGYEVEWKFPEKIADARVGHEARRAVRARQQAEAGLRARLQEARPLPRTARKLTAIFRGLTPILAQCRILPSLVSSTRSPIAMLPAGVSTSCKVPSSILMLRRRIVVPPAAAADDGVAAIDSTRPKPGRTGVADTTTVGDGVVTTAGGGVVTTAGGGVTTIGAGAGATGSERQPTSAANATTEEITTILFIETSSLTVTQEVAIAVPGSK